MGFLLADQSRQCVSQTKAWVKSQFDEIGGKPGLWADHSKVRHNSQTKTTTHCGALHCSDNGDVGIE